MRDLLRAELRQAMKARDTVAVAAVRTTLAAIENAEAVDAATPETMTATGSEHVAGASAGVGSSDVPRRQLHEHEVAAIVQEQIDERHQAAAEYARLGRAAEAERLAREAAVIAGCLPPGGPPPNDGSARP
jgi:hypothetical protein